MPCQLFGRRGSRGRTRRLFWVILNATAWPLAIAQAPPRAKATRASDLQARWYSRESAPIRVFGRRFCAVTTPRAAATRFAARISTEVARCGKTARRRAATHDHAAPHRLAPAASAAPPQQRRRDAPPVRERTAARIWPACATTATPWRPRTARRRCTWRRRSSARPS